jgi:hypothetical protein
MDTLPPLAEVSDLEKRLERTFSDGAETERAEAVLDDASELVREASGKDWVNPDDPSAITAPRIVRLITLRVAERAVRNPEGFSSESAGDYSYQRNGLTDSGGLYLTDQEREMLRRAAGKNGLWTQRITRGEAWHSTVWLDDNFGIEPFPADTRPWWW